MICVYVPVASFADFFSGPWRLSDADGRTVEVRSCRIDLVDARLCFVAAWLGATPNGRHRVRFGDGTEAVVSPSPEWRHVPPGAEPLPEDAMRRDSPLAA